MDVSEGSTQVSKTLSDLMLPVSNTVLVFTVASAAKSYPREVPHHPGSLMKILRETPILRLGWGSWIL